jgi:hypothetical protein
MRSFQKYFLAFEFDIDKLNVPQYLEKHAVPKFNFCRTSNFAVPCVPLQKYCSYSRVRAV